MHGECPHIRHQDDLENMKLNDGTLDGKVGLQIVRFIDSKIKRIITKAENASYLLQDELKNLPAAARDENGKLIFEDGKLKIENEPIDQAAN